MGHGGARKKRVRVRDELRWYEILMCCCKCRRECKTCVTILCMYYIPTILMLLVSAACITFVVISWINDDCRLIVRIWLIGSAVTPYLLLFFVKALKEPYQGITCFRSIACLTYGIFTSWLVFGAYLFYDTWLVGDWSACEVYLKWFVAGVILLHFVICIIATVLFVLVLIRTCCCCVQNAINPLKPGFVADEYV